MNDWLSTSSWVLKDNLIWINRKRTLVFLRNCTLLQRLDVDDYFNRNLFHRGHCCRKCDGTSHRGAVTTEHNSRRVSVQWDVLGGCEIHTHRAWEPLASCRVGPLALAPVEGGLGGGRWWWRGGGQHRGGGEGVGWVAATRLHRVKAAVDSTSSTPRHTLLSAVFYRPVSQTFKYQCQNNI